MEKRIKELEGKISILEQFVFSLQSQIDLKVDKDGVIGSINISQEGIKIKGNKIEIK